MIVVTGDMIWGVMQLISIVISYQIVVEVIHSTWEDIKFTLFASE